MKIVVITSSPHPKNEERLSENSPLNLRSLMMIYYSVRCGAVKMNCL